MLEYLLQGLLGTTQNVTHTLKNQNQMELPTHACESMYTNTPLTP